MVLGLSHWVTVSYRLDPGVSGPSNRLKQCCLFSFCVYFGCKKPYLNVLGVSPVDTRSTGGRGFPDGLVYSLFYS